MSGLDAPGYHIADGYVRVPETPGFGLILDDAAFVSPRCQGGVILLWAVLMARIAIGSELASV